MDQALSGNHDRPTLTTAQQWQATFDAIQDGIYILDKEHRIIQCNRAFCNLVGLPIEQIIGSACWEVVHKTGLPMETCPEHTMRRTLHRQTQEFAFGERWLEAIVDPVLDADGQLVTTIHILSDVTDRQRDQALIKQQRDTLNGINESIQPPIFSVDVNYCYTSFNSSHAQIMKAIYGADIELGKCLLDYQTVAEDRTKARQNLDRALQGEIVIEESESGDSELNRMYFEVTHSPICNEGGAVVGVAIMAHDLTHFKRAESALIKSEEGFRRLFENMTDGFAVHEMIYDSTGKPMDYRFLGVNAAFERMTGLTAAQIIGQTVLSVIPELEDSWIERYGKVVSSGESMTFEDSALALGRTFQVTAYRSGPRQFATMITDVTERRQMLDELHSSEESYRQLFEMGSDALFLIERESGSILQANPAASKMYGYTNEELLKLRNVDLSVEQSATRQATQGGTTIIPRRIHHKKDGTIFPVDITAAHFSWHGKVVHLVAIRDATERERAETILRKSEAMLTAAERMARMGSWEFNVATDTAVCSENMYKIYDVDPTKPDVLAMINFLQHVVHPEDQEKVHLSLEAALKHHAPYDLEYRIVRSDGTVRDIHAIADVFFNDEGQPIRMVGSLQDITERTQTDARLKDQLVELRRWYDITMGRETRILELKREVNQLLEKAGLPARYASAQN